MPTSFEGKFHCLAEVFPSLIQGGADCINARNLRNGAYPNAVRFVKHSSAIVLHVVQCNKLYPKYSPVSPIEPGGWSIICFER